MPKIAIEAKGPAPDSSDYIAILKRRVIVNSQVAKTPADDPTVKPIIGREFHLQKGYDIGVLPWKFTKGLNSVNRF